MIEPPLLQHRTAEMKRVDRYHPLIVTLHWLLAVLIVAELLMGFGLVSAPNADPRKIEVLFVHMVTGASILGLSVIRFVARLATSRPPDAASGHRLLDRAAALSHWIFYALILLMVATGFATALEAGLPETVFAHSGDLLPPTFAVYPAFAAHVVLAVLLSALITLHIAMAAYHHFARKDKLLRRMTFGRREANSVGIEE